MKSSHHVLGLAVLSFGLSASAFAASHPVASLQATSCVCRNAPTGAGLSFEVRQSSVYHYECRSTTKVPLVPAIVAKPVQYSPELDKVCASGYGPLTELLGRLSCSISLGETLGNVTVKDACVKNGTENHAVSFADIGKKKCDLLKQWVAADSSIIRKSDCPANKPNPSFGEWVNVSKSGADKCKIAVAQEIKGVAAVPAHYQYGDVACTVTTEAVVNDAN